MLVLTAALRKNENLSGGNCFGKSWFGIKWLGKRCSGLIYEFDPNSSAVPV